MAFLKDLKEKILPSKKEEFKNDNTDTFSASEQKAIVDMICQDIEADEQVSQEWKEKRKKDLDRYYGKKPSELEGIKVKNWQSDRNLGIAGSVVDIYQSVLSAACWNPESIHFVANEENDIDRKDDLERFTKWMVGTSEVNLAPEVDDYIHNGITQGFSIFEIYRDVWFEWVDRRIPNKGKDGKLDGTFTIQTEKVRFERGVVENIDNLDDILMPKWGDDIQKLPHIMRIVHLTGDRIISHGKSGQFINVDAKMVEKFKHAASGTKSDTIDDLKSDVLGLEDVVDDKFRASPIDIYRWYGWYTKNGKTERYRFMIEPTTRTFLAGKPMRKVMRIPKYPLVGGPFDKIPGQLRGRSMIELIKDPDDAINLTFNQKADFQYITNVPFGFHKAGEGYTKSNYDLEPGVSFSTEGNPSDEVYFPNLQRSMAWAQVDFQMLLEVIERRTGAASFFQTTQSKDTTATRDMIVKEKSDTRFGKWIARKQSEICEAITMVLSLYQDHAPDNLAQRVIGENGKKLFPNLSIETLRYNGDVRMEPDITSGSKAFDRQVKLWGFNALQQSVWFSPQLNPKGSWLLTCDTMKSQGFPAPERYLPPMPKPEIGTSQAVDSIWARISQGEVVEVEPNWNIPEVLAGMRKKKAEKYFDLDAEYRPNLDNLIFHLEVDYQIFMKKAAEDHMASMMAQKAITAGQGGQGGQPMPQAGAIPQGAQNVPPAPEQAQPDMGNQAPQGAM